MVVAHDLVVLEVDSLGLIAECGLFSGEAVHVALAAGTGGGAFKSFATFAAFLSAAGGAAGGVLAVVFDLAGDVGVGGESAGCFSAAFSDGFVADELAAGFSLASFAGSSADFAGVGEAVSGGTFGTHVGDGAIGDVPAGAFVEGVGGAGGDVFHFVEEVLFFFHEVADEVFEFAGQFGHGGFFAFVSE